MTRDLTRTTLVGGECSQHCVIPAPPRRQITKVSISPPCTHKTVNLIPTFENEKPKHQPQCYSNDLAFRVQTELFVTFIGIKRVSTCNKLQS